jgi:hypothetical protein
MITRDSLVGGDSQNRERGAGSGVENEKSREKERLQRYAIAVVGYEGHSP